MTLDWPKSICLVLDSRSKAILDTIPSLREVVCLEELPNGKIILANREQNNSGLFIYEPETKRLSDRIDVGLPPNCLAIYRPMFKN